MLSKKTVSRRKNSKVEYSWFEALVFMKDNMLHIHKLFEGDEDRLSLFAPIKREDINGPLKSILEKDSVHIVRILYDEKDEQDFSLLYFYNFYGIDTNAINDKSNLAKLIEAMENYSLFFSENSIMIKGADDVNGYLDAMGEYFKRNMKPIKN